MPSDDARKRKACQACTRAKAKCSPYGDGSLDICYRCQRLSKECIFEEAARKRKPKSRSRVKQLERRVESLVDLLGVNGQPYDNQISNGTSTSVPTVPIEASHSIASASTAYSTPEETSTSQSKNRGKIDAYDPIEAGIVSIDRATILLNQFRDSFILSFPFVVIPAFANVDSLRRYQPFLFLAIMTTMTFETPTLQHDLAEEFKAQMASRIIGFSHKSLEILQGLLIHAAWYHFFYRPKNQQLSIVLQLCVAMTHDLNLAKDQNVKARTSDLKKCPREEIERSLAQKRALLGTYFLVAAFTQAFRKPSTMNYTKYMLSCCHFLNERQEQPTDALIAPLIRLSELMGRINNQFSYDDVDSAMAKGDVILEMSMAHFRSELEGIKVAIPITFRQNKMLDLYCCLLNIWIHESSLHSSLWTPSSSNTVSLFSPARLTTLSHALQAMKTYLNTLLDTPPSSFHHLAFPAWSGWFYAVIVACKLVFLSHNKHLGEVSLDALPHELNNLLPNHCRLKSPHRNSPHPQIGFWDPALVAKEAEILDLSEKFIQKMKFTIPPTNVDWADETVNRDPLFSMACLQRSLLNGFNKKMKEYTSGINAPNITMRSTHTPNAQRNPNNHATPSNSTGTQGTGPHINAIADYIEARAARPTPTPYHGMNVPLSNTHRPHPGVASSSGTHDEDPAAFFLDQLQKHPVPGLSMLNFNSLNFDGIEFNNDGVPEGENVDMAGMDVGGEEVTRGYDDWAWDLMMQDFSMPGM